MEREFAKEQTSEMKLTGEHVTAFNLSSYNYLGFAESDLEMRDEVCILWEGWRDGRGGVDEIQE